MKTETTVSDSFLHYQQNRQEITHTQATFSSELSPEQYDRTLNTLLQTMSKQEQEIHLEVMSTIGKALTKFI